MGKKNSPSNAELRAELRAVKKYNIVEAVAGIAITLIKFGVLAFLGYCFWQSTVALAGKQTAADIGINLLGEVRISEAVAWLFGAGGIGYGLRERTLRKDHTERIAGRMQTLEREIDPDRTSSGLTARGDTHPKD